MIRYIFIHTNLTTQTSKKRSNCDGSLWMIMVQHHLIKKTIKSTELPQIIHERSIPSNVYWMKFLNINTTYSSCKYKLDNIIHLLQTHGRVTILSSTLSHTNKHANVIKWHRVSVTPTLLSFAKLSSFANTEDYSGKPLPHHLTHTAITRTLRIRQN